MAWYQEFPVSLRSVWSKLEIKCHKILLFFEHYLDRAKLLRIQKYNVNIVDTNERGSVATLMKQEV